MYKPFTLSDPAFLANVFVTGPDPDAEAFLTAAGITDPTIVTTIDNLVVGLKEANIWDKMLAIYPFVGSTASEHKWNLKDPRDLDEAFRLTFFGGITHNSNGVTGNGSNAYYQTHINPANDFIIDDASGWVYSRLNTLSGVDFGRIQTGVAGFQLNIRNDNGDIRSRLHGTSVSLTVNPSSLGLFGISRDNSSNYYEYVNGIFQTIIDNTTGRPDGTLSGLALSASGFFSNRNHAYAAFGQSLSQSQATQLLSIIQAFQTELGREV